MKGQKKKILVATGNEGKMEEIRQILGGENILFSSLKDEKHLRKMRSLRQKKYVS